MVLWAVSRTAGLPFGPEPWMPEPVGRPDFTATLLEGATIVALVLLLVLHRTAIKQPVADLRRHV